MHEALIAGVPVDWQYSRRKRGDLCADDRLRAPGRVRFVVVNQFTIQGDKQPRRPDLVCFINDGLPVINRTQEQKP
ncbi:MAG: hypothetical protein IPH39_18155 [Sulfuritalea sp.]|nr:hypothetical protein [Sulfuritalea sp.]